MKRIALGSSEIGGDFVNLDWNAKDYGNGFSFVHEYGEDVMTAALKAL